MKESVIKADGRGLSIPLNEIVFNQGCVQYGGNQWYLSTFQLDSNHGGCLASNELSGKLEIKEIPLESVIMDLSKRK